MPVEGKSAAIHRLCGKRAGGRGGNPSRKSSCEDKKRKLLERCLRTQRDKMVCLEERQGVEGGEGGRGRCSTNID